MKLIHVTGKKGSGKNIFLDVAKASGYITEELDHGYKALLTMQHPKLIEIPPPEQWTDHIIKLVFEECWLKSYSPDASIFFTGLYRPIEIAYLRSRPEVSLKIVAVEVEDDLTRYKRLLRRSRPGEEKLTLDDYVKKDLHREGIPQAYKNNSVSTIIAMADYRITNNLGLDIFIKNAKILIDTIEREFIRV